MSTVMKRCDDECQPAADDLAQPSPLYYSDEGLVRIPAAGTPWSAAGPLAGDLLGAGSFQERKRLVRSMLHTIGFEWLTYGTVAHESSGAVPLTVNTTHANPFWLSRYFSSGYFGLDPRQRNARTSGRPLLWNIKSLVEQLNMAGTPILAQRFIEDLRSSGIRSGLIIKLPLPDSRVSTVISLQSETESMDWMSDGIVTLASTLALSMHDYIARHEIKSPPLIKPDRKSNVRSDVLRALLQGHTDAEIAAQLQISVHLVDYHMRRLRKHLNVRNRVELVIAVKRMDETGTLR
jgi:DNA-binding CsgD family transcriptional regulator